MKITEKRKNTSHFAIFNYWKDKCIDRFGNIKDNIPENFEGTVEVVTDWGEPECWCCKCSPMEIYEQEKYEQWISDESDVGLRELWNSAPVRRNFEKAHIVPHALGGSDDPENFFILCHKCHKDSPDTNDPKMFLSYIWHKRNNNTLILAPYVKAIKILHEEYGITNPDFSGEHTQIGLHGGTVSESSYTAQLVSIAVKNHEKLKNTIKNVCEILL